MNRHVLRVLLPVLFLAAVLAFALALSPLTRSSAHTTASHARVHVQAPTPTPTAPQDESQPGSTDGLMIMGFAIAAVISLPLLLQRAMWTR